MGPGGDLFDCGQCPDGFTGDGVDCVEIDACSVEKPCYTGTNVIKLFVRNLQIFVIS